MNLHHLLQARDAQHKPLRVALIGAGKFGSMFLSQIRATPGMHLVAVADLSPERARAALASTGWPAERIDARSSADAVKRGTTHVTDDGFGVIRTPETEIVVDATGNPSAGIAHVLACCEHGKHIVMVNVEADALAGPLLARRRGAGGHRLLARLRRPAGAYLRNGRLGTHRGLRRRRGGQGHQVSACLPRIHAGHGVGPLRLTAEDARIGGMNPQMFNSFLDGTKSAIEMAAVANATGLTPAPDGLAFPPCGVDDLPRVLRPRDAGGQLHHRGQVEVISSLERDGRPVFRDLRWGVYVTFNAGTQYAARCFREYGLLTDDSGQYTAMYKPYHLIGLELGVSVASVGLRGEPTGAARRLAG